jgi:TatD DNase family protein
MHDQGPRSASAPDGAPSVLPPFIDAHAHLASEQFAADLPELLARLKAAGGVGAVCIGESLAAAAEAKRVADRYPDCVWWTAGVHPHDAAGFDPIADVAALDRLLGAGAVAVGECGLDYHYDHSPRALQRRAFAAQLALAAQHRKPVVLHTREAEEDTIAMLREAGEAGIRGVLHCFTGSPALADAGLEAGWYVSYAGVLTFKKWDGDDLVRRIPGDRLVIESDSPYLAPVPFRGKRNEPAWCAYTLQRLAAVRGEDPVALGAQLVANTRALFGLA